MKDIHIAFAKRLKKIRKAIGMTQKDMAQSIGVSNSYFSEIEKGKNGPGFEIIYNLCTKYQVNPQYLIKGEGSLFISSEESEPKQLHLEDFGPLADDVEKLLWHMKHSKSLLYAMFEYFQSYKTEKEALIKLQITRSQEEELPPSPKR